MKGLLLIGGKSTRMGQDKSQLVLRDGLNQKQRGMGLLEKFCEEVYVSTAEDEGQGSIPDAYGNIGPLGAVASAQSFDPHAAWLVLACDLPLLEYAHLEQLVAGRDVELDATCFMSASDGLPEPLCAIWEPTSSQHVRVAVEQGQRCPRRLLENLQCKKLPPLEFWALANTNTKADVLEVEARLSNNLTTKAIKLTYFAQIREVAGVDEENYSTDSVTAAGVFEELRAKYGLPMKRKGMMIAINGDFADWSQRLEQNDELVFIPPVAGG